MTFQHLAPGIGPWLGPSLYAYRRTITWPKCIRRIYIHRKIEFGLGFTPGNLTATSGMSVSPTTTTAYTLTVTPRDGAAMTATATVTVASARVLDSQLQEDHRPARRVVEGMFGGGVKSGS